jgi:uncharacterized protein HemX
MKQVSILQMMPTINRLMMQLDKEQNNVDELMKYLDDTLCLLSTHLSSDNFKHILNKIWRNVSQSVCSFMENNIKVRIVVDNT